MITSKNRVEITMEQDELIDFIFCLMDLQDRWTYHTTTNEFILKVKNVNNWRVKRAIYERLSVPERKENFMTFTTCSCTENTNIVDRNCPIHGENNQL